MTAASGRPPTPTRPARIGGEPLHAAVTALAKRREWAYAVLREANGRGLMSADLDRFRATLDAIDADMAALIKYAGLTKARWLFAEPDGSVRSWYGGDRYRVIVRGRREVAG